MLNVVNICLASCITSANSKDARANGRKPTHRTLRQRQHIVHIPVTLPPTRFDVRRIRQCSPCCPLVGTNLPTPRGWTVWLTVPAPGIEPRPARLAMQEIVRDLIHSATQTDNVQAQAALKIYTNQFNSK